MANAGKLSRMPRRFITPCDKSSETFEPGKFQFTVQIRTSQTEKNRQTGGFKFLVGAKGNQPFFLNPWFSCFFVFNPLKIPYKCITLCIPILKISRFRPKVQPFLLNFSSFFGLTDWADHKFILSVYIANTVFLYYIQSEKYKDIV